MSVFGITYILGSVVIRFPWFQYRTGTAPTATMQRVAASTSPAVHRLIRFMTPPVPPRSQTASVLYDPAVECIGHAANSVGTDAPPERRCSGGAEREYLE